jgi:hypothetical protein
LSAKEISGSKNWDQLLSFVNTGALRNNETIVTNTRHYDSLLKALDEIQKVKYGLETELSSDLMYRYQSFIPLVQLPDKSQMTNCWEIYLLISASENK